MSQQGALTSWRRQRAKLLNTWKESEPVRGAPSMKRVEVRTGRPHAWGGAEKERHSSDAPKSTARREGPHADSGTTGCACRNRGRRRPWPTRGVRRASARGRRTSRVSTRSHARSASAMKARRASVVGWVAAINGGMVTRSRTAFRIAAVVTGCEQARQGSRQE